LFFDPGVDAIEAIDPSVTGYLGGLGLPILVAWPVGALFAAGVAFVIGKIALGLRSDYLAIATLGISEIIIFFIKNEEWLTRGVKNVNGLPRPVPYEIDLQQPNGSKNGLWLSVYRLTTPQQCLSKFVMRSCLLRSLVCCCGCQKLLSNHLGAG